MIKYSSFLFCIIAISLLCSGCVDSEKRTKEMRDCPAMSQAVDAERRGDVNTAISLYSEVAAMYPSEPAPCLKLALLLHDHKHDYLGAIYNYRRFISNAKTFNDKQELSTISNRIEKAKQSVAQELLQSIASSSASPDVKAFQDFNKQNSEIEKLKKLNKELTESDNAKQKKIDSLEATIKHLELAIDKMKRFGVDGSKNVSKPGVLVPYEYTDANGVVKSGMTYEVEDGDSLSSISRKIYGDAGMWTRISNANRDKIVGERVKRGDVLIIPWP